jgi:DegV family protein with EDD domain
MLRIVTDGGADMPEGWQEKYEINILPLTVRLGEKTYFQGSEINKENFYKLVEEIKEIPKTSLPSLSQIKDYYRSIAQRGDQILSIHVGGLLSGTYDIVQMAARELIDEFEVVPFDSGAGSAVLGFMCRDARVLYQQGASIVEIKNHLDDICKKLTVIFTLNTLEFAYLNGRISAMQSAISSLLKIKPIVMLKDGLLIMYDKVRTRQRSIEYILDLIRNRFNMNPVHIAVVHAADPKIADLIVSRINGLLNCMEIVVTDLSIPVAANLGPGTVGIVAYQLDQEVTYGKKS